jgi:hypothetical protein
MVIRAAAGSRVSAESFSRASASVVAPERRWNVALVCGGRMPQSSDHWYGPASETAALILGSYAAARAA